MGLRRLSIVTIALAAAGGAALADIGPKPRIDIAFSFDRPGLSIQSGQLYECDSPACQASRPLQPLGPQRVVCAGAECGGEAYGFTDYVWIEVVLSDGRTLRSPPFAKRDFDEAYRAEVRGPALRIEPAKG